MACVDGMIIVNIVNAMKKIRKFLAWCTFKILYRLQCLIDCGKLKRPSFTTPVKIKWLSRLNYKLAKKGLF